MEWMSFIKTTINVLTLLLVSPFTADGLSFLFQSGLGEGSHFLTSATIAEALVNKGHSVTYLISNACEYQTNSPRWGQTFTFEIFNHSYPPEQALDRLKAYVRDSVDEGVSAAAFKHIRDIVTSGGQDCDDLLSDSNLMDRLRHARFDAIVSDVVWPCSSLMGTKLNLTKIFVNPSGYMSIIAVMYGAPVNPSYVVSAAENVPRLPLTFLQRLINLFEVHLQSAFFMGMYSLIYNDLMKKHNISPHRNLDAISADAELVLFNMDFSAENSVPLPPHIVTVGGLTSGAAKPLPKDIENFVQGSGDNGVVLFSLGSYVNNTNAKITRTIIEAFKGLKCRVMWKFHNVDNLTIPSNVKVMEWLPLNDLLGHRKTKVFVYQGGNNAFYEALYHGVPIVVLPALGDQGQVASRVVNAGIGKTLDIREMTSEDLRNTIIDVLSDKKIQSEMKRLSAIYRNKPMTPLEKATYWIEHVAKFGGKHYRPPLLDKSFVEASLIDVYGFLTVIAVLSFLVCYKLMTFILRLFVNCCCGT